MADSKSGICLIDANEALNEDLFLLSEISMRSNLPRDLHSVPVLDPLEPDDEGPTFVDPDEGPIQALIQDDPEYDRIVSPND